MSAEPAGGARPVLDAVVFSVDGRAVTRGEIRRWAERFDPRFVTRVARRATLGARADATDDDAALESEVEEFAAEFRYARALESAEAFVRWTEQQGISVDDWWESIRISALERRAEASGDPSEFASDADRAGAVVEPDEAVSSADLVVTDLLAHATEELARRMAVARSLDRLPEAWIVGGRASASEIDARHDVLEHTWSGWRQAVTDELSLRRAVERERLAWIVFDLLESRWRTESAASEAVACVRLDGLALEDVARDADAACIERTCVLGDLGTALRDALVTAAPGELVGPVAQDAHWIVAAVRAKRVPSLSDPLVRTAAVGDAVARAAAPLVERHLRLAEPA
ncbi:MAG: hypothetical protein IT457_09890 [Planctomycetes bacterium]|nr:hypothetical protein [Planctomycetota bacterium]